MMYNEFELNTFKRNKKIALRFLKDLGLYTIFARYARNECLKFSRSGAKWYEYPIINIFGRLNFTYFLEKNHLAKYHCNVTELFILYVYKNYGVDFLKKNITGGEYNWVLNFVKDYENYELYKNGSSSNLTKEQIYWLKFAFDGITFDEHGTMKVIDFNKV